MEGSANSSFFNLGAASDAQRAGTNISAIYGPNRPAGNPDKAASDGTIYKATTNLLPTKIRCIILLILKALEQAYLTVQEVQAVLMVLQFLSLLILMKSKL